MSTTISSDDSLDEKIEVAETLDRDERIPFFAKILTDEEKIALGKDSFKFFANLVSYNWLAETPDDWYPVPDHAMDWHRTLHEERKPYIILAGRKHSKSTWAFGEMLHGLQYTEGFEVLYWANTQKQVSARIGELEDIIKANPWLTNLHVNGTVPGGLSKEFPNGSKLHTTSVGGSAEGSHVHLSIGDDVLKEIGQIRNIQKWYQNVIVPMRNEDGMDTIIGTRKRPDDLYFELRDLSKDLKGVTSYQLREYPAIREPWYMEYHEKGRANDLAPQEMYTRMECPHIAEHLDIPNDNVSILWPEARGSEFLLQNLGRQGIPSFMREFCMVYQEAEDSIIPRSSIDALSTSEEPPYRFTPAEREVFDRVVTGIDPAVADRGDHMAFVTVGLRKNVRHILDVFVEQGISPTRFKEKLVGVYERYDPNQMIIESNGFQQWLENEAIEFDERLPVTSKSTSRKKHSWKEGVPKIAADVERGLYRFYTGGQSESDATMELINSLTSLRMDESDKLVGHTPDTVMALYQAEKGLRSHTSDIVDMNVATGDQDEELAERERDVRSTLTEGGSTSEIGEALLGIRDGH